MPVGTRSTGAALQGTSSGGGGGGGGGLGGPRPPTWDCFQVERRPIGGLHASDGTDFVVPRDGSPVYGPEMLTLDHSTGILQMKRTFVDSDSGVPTPPGGADWVRMSVNVRFHPTDFNAAAKGTAVVGIGADYGVGAVFTGTGVCRFRLYDPTSFSFGEFDPFGGFFMSISSNYIDIDMVGGDSGSVYVWHDYGGGHYPVPLYCGWNVDLVAGTISGWYSTNQNGSSPILTASDGVHDAVGASLIPSGKVLPELYVPVFLSGPAGTTADHEGFDLQALATTGGGGGGGGFSTPGSVSAGKPKSGPVAVSKNIVGVKGTPAAL